MSEYERERDEARAEVAELRVENERLRAIIVDLRGRSFAQVMEENERLRADRPVYVKPNIREIKFSKRSTTP